MTTPPRGGKGARHNLAYWRQEPWLAAGPSGSAHVGGHRWKNTPRLDDYLEHEDGGFAPIVDHEPPDARRAIAERMMTGLRLAEGLPIPELEAAIAGLATPGPSLARLASVRKVADLHQSAGHLARRGDRWMLTDSGFLLADGIAADFMSALDD